MSEFEQTQQSGDGDGGQPQDGDQYGVAELGGELGDDYSLGAAGIGDAPKKKHTGALVLIVTVLLAAGSLFSMHTLTKVTASSGKNTEIERTIEQFLKNMGPETPGADGVEELVEGHSEVVAALTDNYTEHQITDLDRNPFALFGGPTGTAQSDTGARIDQVERAANKLILKSVIGGRRPLANINGRIVRLNQIVPVELSKAEGTVKFRVTAITRKSVTLVAEDADIEKPFEKTIHLKKRSR